MYLQPKSFTSGSLKVYRFGSKGQTLEFVHETDIDGVPMALCPFQGKLLVGTGTVLRIYDIGKKKLLRKCESKVLALDCRVSREISLKFILKEIVSVSPMPPNPSSLLCIDISIIALSFSLMILPLDG
jgi:hypothetical protein